MRQHGRLGGGGFADEAEESNAATSGSQSKLRVAVVAGFSVRAASVSPKVSGSSDSSLPATGSSSDCTEHVPFNWALGCKGSFLRSPVLRRPERNILTV